MAAAVVNASPLIFLAKLHRLDALRVFAPVLTTREAIGEVMEGVTFGYQDAIAVREAVLSRRVTVRPTPAVSPALASLGPGERSVLALARRTAGATAIMDDLGAIKAAHSIGVPVRSTPFVLLDNLALGRLDAAAFRQALDALVEHGYFLSPRLYLRLLTQAGAP